MLSACGIGRHVTMTECSRDAMADKRDSDAAALFPGAIAFGRHQLHAALF
jgi:hypothetical protein